MNQGIDARRWAILVLTAVAALLPGTLDGLRPGAPQGASLARRAGIEAEEVRGAREAGDDDEQGEQEDGLHGRVGGESRESPSIRSPAPSG